jgi:hypothetical protein|tara:strand:+ start:9950 stop:10150 length:201 start_codon:yes stop_codon:yes gene_type:complete
MASVDAMDIVNKLFTGSKDLSKEVDVALKAMTADALEAKKKDIAGNWMDPAKTPEEETDETDHGND